MVDIYTSGAYYWFVHKQFAGEQFVSELFGNERFVHGLLVMVYVVEHTGMKCCGKEVWYAV